MARRRYDNDDFTAYVPAAARREKAQKTTDELSQKGETLFPVVVGGRDIAKTFWGKAWCKNIESYQDYESRLPRGRSYLRNGSVIDLQISSGLVTAQVLGAELYEIRITIKTMDVERWNALKKQCAGKINSLIDLVQGKLSPEIIELLCDLESGMFPAPDEIKMICNCLDWADLCKHLAAVLYGIGARLDQQPELFFVLRGVDQRELLGDNLVDTLVADSAADLDCAALSDVFGIELDTI